MNSETKNILHFDGKKIPYSIQFRKGIKNIRLSYNVQANCVDLIVPKQCSMANFTAIFQKHKRWIVRRFNENNRIVNKPPFELKDGASLPLLNQIYRLHIKVDPSQKKTYWHCLNHEVNLTVPYEKQEWIICGIESWYKKMAKLYLSIRLDFWGKKMKLAYNRVSVKNQKSLWGSCSKKRNLNFNWRMMLLSAELADYLMIHELSHLIQMNHSKRFWQTVEKYCPNYQKLEKSLKEKNYLLTFPDSYYSSSPNGKSVNSFN